MLYNSAGAGPLVQNSAGADQQAQQWMIPCSLSVNTARRLSKLILTKLCFFNYNRISLAYAARFADTFCPQEVPTGPRLFNVNSYTTLISIFLTLIDNSRTELDVECDR